MIVDGRPSIYEEAYMDDFVTGLLVGACGEDLFRKIARKKYFLPFFFLFLIIITQIMVVIFFLILEIYSIFKGDSDFINFQTFLFEFLKFSFLIIQPYALLFSAFISLLGTLSYLWHRKYSHPQSDKDSGET